MQKVRKHCSSIPQLKEASSIDLPMAGQGFHLCEGIQAEQQLVMTCFSLLFSRKKATFSDEQTTEIVQLKTSAIIENASFCIYYVLTKYAYSLAEVSGIQNTELFTYKELKMATGNFHYSNKNAEGGFGVVYKQGVREFLTELNVIADIEHENLVKLCGCCVEGNHRILVYGYLENNSLAQTLLEAIAVCNSAGKQDVTFALVLQRGLLFFMKKFDDILFTETSKQAISSLIKISCPKFRILVWQSFSRQPDSHKYTCCRNNICVLLRLCFIIGNLAPEYAISVRFMELVY
ncbi:hypothetical protein CRYUN_Cryun38cG0040800 [Craigia yunnanensis]